MPCSPRALSGDVGPALQRFHDLLTHRLNDKVALLQHLRTQNEVLEGKLMNIHQLFSEGKERSGSIISEPAQPGGADHGAHEEATAADAREQDRAAEMDPAALQEPVDAAAVAGEAIDDATTMPPLDQSRESRPCSPDLQLAQSPKRWASPPHAPPAQQRSHARSVLVRAAAAPTRATRPRP